MKIVAVLFFALGFAGCSESVDSSGTALLLKYSQKSTDSLAQVIAFHRNFDGDYCYVVAQDSRCKLSICALGGLVDPKTGQPLTKTPTYLDGGPVTFAAKSTATFVAGTGGGYASTTQPDGQFFDGGETVKVTFAGKNGDPPAAMLSFTAPGDLVFTSPTAPSVTAERSQDLAFAWTPTFGDSVSLDASVASSSQATDAAGADSLSCTWPMADGHGVIPSSLLSKLPPGTVDASTSIGAIRTENHGRWQLSVGASVPGPLFSLALQ